MSSSGVPINTDNSHCQHFVARKKRFCRMTLRAGAKYCGEHEQQVKLNETNDSDNSRKRMPCPLDPNHTCYVSKLTKHLKICNARQTQQPEYIVKGCNFNGNNTDPDIHNKGAKFATLSLVPIDKLQAVVKKVNDLYALLIEGHIKKHEQLIPHHAVKAELENEGRGNNTKKHLLQNSALLYLLEQNNLVDEYTCYVELGAGKGHLSYFLSQAISETKTSSVLLVDRQSHRHKQDNKIDKETHVVDRIRADICDLRLSKVEVVDKAKKMVAVSKHLCGMATDLAIRCITNEELKDKTYGVMMATCCHHRCEFESYVAADYLKSSGILSEEFNILCGLVSWATCGSGFSRARRSALATNTDDKLEPKRIKIDSSEKEVSPDQSDMDVLNLNCAKNKLGLGFKERTEVGRKAKAFLDWGRIQYLKQKGFDAHLWHYVESDVSPENVCIVATRAEKKDDINPDLQT